MHAYKGLHPSRRSSSREQLASLLDMSLGGRKRAAFPRDLVSLGDRLRRDTGVVPCAWSRPVRQEQPQTEAPNHHLLQLYVAQRHSGSHSGGDGDRLGEHREETVVIGFLDIHAARLAWLRLPRCREAFLPRPRSRRQPPPQAHPGL